MKPLAIAPRRLDLTLVKPPLHADGNSEETTHPSRSRLAMATTTVFFGALGGLVGYGAASSIGDGVVCAASRSPLTVALYVACASTLAAWTIADRH